MQILVRTCTKWGRGGGVSQSKILIDVNVSPNKLILRQIERQIHSQSINRVFNANVFVLGFV